MKRAALLSILFSAVVLATAPPPVTAQSDNMIHVKQYQGGNVGAMVQNAMVNCPPASAGPCLLVLDASLYAYPSGTMPTLCSQCVLIDYRGGGPGIGPSIGALLMCDQFPGADVSIKANACNAAIIAAGGGTMDLRKLLAGATTGSQEIDIGTRASDNAQIGIVALFPATATYTTTMIGGPAVAATVYPSAGGAGYVTGDLVYPVETGFAYTGVAAGAVFSVVASGGAVTSLVLVSPGSGYIGSKYVTTTTNGVGTGLIMNLQAADCGIRQNGRTTIQTGSVNAGAATFDITPSNSNTGFVGEAGFCTDAGAGYTRLEGGLRSINYTSGAHWSAGDILITAAVDDSKFDGLETSGDEDDGLRVRSACCGTNFESSHSAMNATGAGYGTIIGAGGTIQNACITNGSAIITAPYAHFTSEYIGDSISAGVQGGSTGFPAATVTAINSFTSLTVSAAATGTTNSSNALCTQAANLSPVPPLTGGTGLTLRMSDPTQPATIAVSFYHSVFNESAPGLPNLLITQSTGAINIFGAYSETNTVTDDYSPISYVAYGAVGTNFYDYYASGPSSGGTKYGVWTDSPYGLCLFGANTNTGLMVQGATIPKSQAGNLTYCQGQNPQVFDFQIAATPLAATTVYFGQAGIQETSISGKVPGLVVPRACNVYAVQYSAQVSGTLDSAAHYFQMQIYSNGVALADTIATVASTSLPTNAGASQVLISTPTDAIAPNTTLTVQVLYPTFSTTPTGLTLAAKVYCQ